MVAAAAAGAVLGYQEWQRHQLARDWNFVVDVLLGDAQQVVQRWTMPPQVVLLDDLDNDEPITRRQIELLNSLLRPVGMWIGGPIVAAGPMPEFGAITVDFDGLPPGLGDGLIWGLLAPADRPRSRRRKY